MKQYVYLPELPDALYQIITPDLLKRMINYMGIGSIPKIAKISNVTHDSVQGVIKGEYRDDFIVGAIVNTFAKQYEDREYEKFSLTSLAVLYE